MAEAQFKVRTKLVRMSNELFEELSAMQGHDSITVEWGEPIEYVMSEDNGKQYMEPVYGPTIYINDNNDPKARA